MQKNPLTGFLLKEGSFTSRNSYKRAVLRGQLSLLGMSVGLVYLMIDCFNHLYVSMGMYALLIGLCSIVFWINRSGKHHRANFIFLPLLLFLIYVFADNDFNRTGVGTYFIVYALIALTLCGYEKIEWGLFFSFLALSAFFIAYFVDMPALIPHVNYSPFYITVSFVTNFLVSFLTALALIFFSLDINYKTEQELFLKNEKLLKVNAELDRFVYSASHDLRAPLSSLLGLIELCQRTDDPKEVKECLAMMKVRIADLNAFIREIIDYSRNTRQEIREENFNVMELVKEVCTGLKFGTGMEKIDIRLLISPDLNVYTDRSRMKVILNNLIGNALKYNNPYQEKPYVSIEAKCDQDHLVLGVADNGIGIGTEHLPKIFEMFYRASEKSEGSGLGLYIVKEALEKLYGRIEVTSQYGHGSEFKIFIPVKI